RCKIVRSDKIGGSGHSQAATAEGGDLRRDTKRPRRFGATTAQEGKDRPAAFPLALSQQERPSDGRRPRPAARRDAEMAADRAGDRPDNDKIVLAERVGGERAAPDLERPFHTVLVRRRGKLPPD